MPMCSILILASANEHYLPIRSALRFSSRIARCERSDRERGRGAAHFALMNVAQKISFNLFECLALCLLEELQYKCKAEQAHASVQHK